MIGVVHIAPPNKSLQRTWTHKVLGRGRPSAENTRGLRARVLKCRRAAAELAVRRHYEHEHGFYSRFSTRTRCLASLVI
jgi:hypothetical protein